MIIWTLALVLLASLAGLGYRQGAIRVAFSLAGIFAAIALAGPLARLSKPAFPVLGVTNPVLLWIIPLLVAFIVVLCLVKIIGMAVHHKVALYYKYKAGDLRLALWQRLNARLGLCLGLVNGTVYLALISFVLYAGSYWTVQLATSDNDPWSLKILNRIGHDLQSTGMARVARAIDRMPDTIYDVADLVGLVYQNSLLEARLSRYPAFLSLAERPEFQDIAQDTAFMEMRLKGAPIKEVLGNPKSQAILNNPGLLRQIWDTLVPDLSDLRVFLETGKSGKYESERILGRWVFDVNGAMGAYRKLKPNLSSTDAQKMKQWFAAGYTRTTLIAAPDHQVFLKNVPLLKQQPGAAPTAEMQTLQGRWAAADRDYEFSFGPGDDRKAQFEGTRLVVSAGEGTPLVFTKED